MKKSNEGNNKKEKGKSKSGASEKEEPLEAIIREFRQSLSSYEGNEERTRELQKKICILGKRSRDPILKILYDKKDVARRYMPWIIAEIEPATAGEILMPLINDKDLIDDICGALHGINVPVVPQLIKMFNKKLKMNSSGKNALTANNIFLSIGKVQSDESLEFMNSVLDEYTTEMPKEEFDPSELDWKFKNLDFFYILEAFVRQQDERSIDRLKKVRDMFPPEYTDHLSCQIAIGRIIKKKPDDGFLPLEVMDIMIPPWKISDMLFENESSMSVEDWFEREYGEYFTPDIYDRKKEPKKRNRAGKK
ncbi:MAG: hypothetical protein ACYDAO_10075 [Thermoplasmataceae archaeon]